MRFYNQQHKYYCGIDLHARKMYVCILNAKSKVVVHQNIKTDPEAFFDLIFPYIDDIAVGVECVFCWYWLADLCAEHHIRFVLGHALYMKAIHGGKTKNDHIDSYKLASLLKGGNFPIAYAYPAKWRATRDLLRRRMYISRRCAELVAHIVNTNMQYNLPAFKKKLSRKYNHTGVGQILALVILYEIHDINRFARVQDFSSYARLIRPVKESDGKWAGLSNKKIGNHHLKWAIKEATVMMLRDCPEIKYYVSKLTHKYNKGKAMGILTHKLGRAIYFMLKNKEAFDMKKFFAR